MVLAGYRLAETLRDAMGGGRAATKTKPATGPKAPAAATAMSTPAPGAGITTSMLTARRSTQEMNGGKVGKFF